MQSIILLHGALGSKEHFEPLEKILNENGIKTYTFNFAGHGGQPFRDEGFGIKVFCWELQNFIRARKLQKPAVFGYSMGGYVALRLSYKFPGLLGNIITLGTKFAWTSESAQKESRQLDASKIEEKIPAFAESLQRRHHPNDWKLLLHKTSEMMQSLGAEPLLTEKEFSVIRNQTTICLGDSDNMVTREESEAAASMLPNGKFCLLENTPHPIEKTDAGRLARVMGFTEKQLQ